MKSKKESRLRRAAKGRRRIKLQDTTRLCVNKTPRHIYCQLITSDGSKTLASASTLNKELRAKNQKTGNKDSATQVGRIIGEAAKKIGIKKVSFDRSGFKYHGRIKALADAARETGLEF